MPVQNPAAAYDPVDDMMKMKSVQKKWRDSFTSPIADRWDQSGSGASTAATSAGVLTLASGTAAGDWVELLSKETFTIPFRAMFGAQNTRNANNHHIIEAVSVNADTGIPDGRHSMQIDLGGAANMTATNIVYAVQNGGLAPLSSAASAVVTTAAYSVLELEPFSDEAYFHSRTIDSTAGRANSYVRHQQIPDPTAVYKLRLRSMNHGAWKAVTGAVAGTGGVIRLTIAAHAFTGTVWVEALNGVTNNGAEVRGNYAITVVDANTIELNGTTFTGTYAAGSGRAAMAAAPTAVTLQFQFANCQDYAELTAEITAGRGSSVEGQAIAARLVPGTASIGSIGALPAGTAAVGDIGIQYRANATGAASRTHLVSAATTNATIVKATPGRVLGVVASNTSAAWKFLKLHNQTTLPTAGTGVVQTIGLPPNTTIEWFSDGGVAFTTGIGLTITNLVADADATAVAVSDVVADVFFA